MTAGSPWSDELIDDLAMAYHELYRSHAGPDDPVADLSWAELPEDLRESNRATARALRHALATLGYEVRPASGAEAGLTELPAEHVQQLAEAEHARWVRATQARGYVLGPDRADGGHRPTHPDLVAWHQLDADSREKDSIRFSAAPRLLASLGYAIVPTPTP